MRAAIRRGWVWPIWPVTPRPSSRQILGSWVVLPEPVSPAMTTTWWSAITAAISSLQLADRQLGRIGDDRDGAAPGLDAGGRGVEFPGEAAERLVAGRDVAQAGHLVDAPVQPPLVAQHEAGQGGSQLSER